MLCRFGELQRPQLAETCAIWVERSGMTRCERDPGARDLAKSNLLKLRAVAAAEASAGTFDEHLEVAGVTSMDDLMRGHALVSHLHLPPIVHE